MKPEALFLEQTLQRCAHVAETRTLGDVDIETCRSRRVGRRQSGNPSAAVEGRVTRTGDEKVGKRLLQTGQVVAVLHGQFRSELVVAVDQIGLGRQDAGGAVAVVPAGRATVSCWAISSASVRDTSPMIETTAVRAAKLA